jgi:penicillin-binding protein-related factor A (putative recombinase)
MNELEKAFDKGYFKYLKSHFIRINVPDLPPYFKKSTNVGFKPKQIVDRLLLSKKKNIAIELKKSKRKLMSFSRFKDHQTKFLLNFTKKSGDAFYLVSLEQFKKVFLIDIREFLEMKESISKKSFNTSDIDNFEHIPLKANKLRKHYRIDLRLFLHPRSLDSY